MSKVVSKNVTSIGEKAFTFTSLKSVIIPNGATSIFQEAFVNCPSLTIYCEALSKPDGWADGWNPDNRPVVWGYTGE